MFLQKIGRIPNGVVTVGFSVLLLNRSKKTSKKNLLEKSNLAITQ